MGSERVWSSVQQRAITARDGNLLVSAGAGSGKTSVLVERVVQRVLHDDLDLTQLLVVTFTEAAAAEMRQRIAARLDRAAEAALSAGDDPLRRRAQRQRALVEQAQVSTLHSFCMDIVKRNFLVLGIDPTVDILAEDEGAVLRAELLTRMVEERLRDGDAAAFRAMLSRFAQGDPGPLAPLIRRIDTFAQSQPDPQQWLEDKADDFRQAADASFADLVWANGFRGWVQVQLDGALQQLDQAARLAAPHPELSRYATQLTDLRELAVAAGLAFAATRPLADGSAALAAVLQCANERVTAPAHPARDAVRELRNKARDTMGEILEVTARGDDALRMDVVQLAPAIDQLVRFVQDFRIAFDAAKRDKGTVDFGDLEHLARQALQDHTSGEAVRLRAQFVEIYVDEYQDTSPIQDAIVDAIARPEGNVFVVGDVKQSIYRFRMAEPNLFLRRDERLRPAGAVVPLSANYRSRGEVVQAVNYIFDHLFTTGFGGVDYVQDGRMEAGAHYPDVPGAVPGLAAPVEVHLLERRPPDVPAMSSEASEAVEDLSHMEKEAYLIAQRIQTWMGLTGEAQRHVWNPSEQCYEPLRYRDIVVLVRSAKGRMNTILEILRRQGVPAYGATSTGFYGALEIQWLLSVLATIDNPRRDVDLVATLRSPVGGFSDAHLAEIRLAHSGSFWDALRTAARTRPNAPVDSVSVPDGDTPVLAPDTAARARAFVAQLRRWRTSSRRTTAEETLRLVLTDSGFLHYVSAMPGGDLRRANVEALLDRTRSFDATSVDGVFGFVSQARETLAQAVDVGEARTLGEHEDVVRVMTIHQSKGLEFPIVFLADVGKQFFRNAREQAFALHRGLGFGPQFVDPVGHRRWRTLPSLAIEHAELSESLAEEARILYVALTRARERLVLVGSASRLNVLAEAAHAGSGDDALHRLSLGTVLRGKSYLDWLMPIWIRHPDGEPLRQLAAGDEAPEIVGAALDTNGSRFAIQLWNTPDGRALTTDSVAPAPAAALAPEPGHDALGVEDAQVWSAILHWQQPNSFLRTVPGKISATDLRRLWVARAGEGAPTGGSGNAPGFTRQATIERLLDQPLIARSADTGAATHAGTNTSAGSGTRVPGQVGGTAFHAVMQHIDLTILPTADGVTAELTRLVDEGWLDEGQRLAVDVRDVVDFLQSSLGQRVVAARRVLREQSFYHRLAVMPRQETAHAPGRSQPERFVTLQGVIDCLAEETDRWLLVDYKTDRVDARQMTARAREYEAQVAAYLEVAEAVCRPKPVEAYIYFVKLGESVRMQRVELADVFTAREGSSHDG